VASKRTKAKASLDATVHKTARRINIPTAELESFTEDDEKRPQKLVYPRDPTLDPQLVWKGKDEQDRSDLTVLAVPIYIQEKIQPRALIDELLAENTRSSPAPQIDLFGDFNGLEFEKLIDFYQHPMKWQNRLILGDSLPVMASLAEKEGLRGRIQMIYVDPPYGIKFGSNWQVSTRKRDIRDGKAEDASRQPEQIKAFRDTWELGIHSYLAYLRDRLVVARDLLSDTGSVFVQIGDQNVHLVRCLLDEVFGSANFVSLMTFVKTSSATAELIANTTDHLVWYAKDVARAKYRALYSARGDPEEGPYSRVELPDRSRRPLSPQERGDPDLLPAGSRIYRIDNLTSQRPPGDYPVTVGSRTYRPKKGYWKTHPDGMQRLAIAHRLEATEDGDGLYYVRFHDDFPVQRLTNVWTDTVVAGFTSDKVYVVETSRKVLERCLLMTTDPGDLVLDPTCGSGTTATVAEQWGRRWITIDTSRVALALTRTRLMASRFPYYLLADSTAGIAKATELSGKLHELTGPPSNDVSKGFVYERVQHVMLKSIANNPDIKEGTTREEIDAAIARHADSELLYDRPYSDNKIVRVSGPFTVESLSPHRVGESNDGGGGASNAADPTQFVDRIIGNLKLAGVQNKVKGERLVFDQLAPWPGKGAIDAVGQYSESGVTKKVAVCIGPEYGTVGRELVREAAKEAVEIADLLVVCGFAFEPHVGGDATKLGRLTIMKANMNPDLVMADDLLKKTGAANLFMVFGEPDISTVIGDDGMVSVEIRGVDTYNPTTGEIRSDSTDDIACWFIDTDYNGESFFVRHAYFLGAGDPYDKLKRALRAEIDERTWATLYSAKSRPFPKPATRKIAIKVINHYGDEVLKVYPV